MQVSCNYNTAGAFVALSTSRSLFRAMTDVKRQSRGTHVRPVIHCVADAVSRISAKSDDFRDCGWLTRAECENRPVYVPTSQGLDRPFL